MKKLGGHKNFSWEIGGSQKNQEIIGWLQILMKILFKGCRMGPSDKVSLWYVALLINTRFRFFILE